MTVYIQEPRVKASYLCLAILLPSFKNSLETATCFFRPYCLNSVIMQNIKLDTSGFGGERMVGVLYFCDMSCI